MSHTQNVETTLPRTLARKPGTGVLGLSAAGVEDLERTLISMDSEAPFETQVDAYIAREMADHEWAVSRGWFDPTF